MNILIVKLSAIGDVVHTLPSLAALRNLYPQAHITWVIEEAAGDLIEGHPLLDRVILSRRKAWLRELKSVPLRTLNEIGAFIREVRDRRYDLVIDFHGLLKSSLIVFLAAGRRRLGYDSMQELSGLFLNEKIPEDMTKHAVERYLDLVRHLGAVLPPGSATEFLLPIGAAETKKIESLLGSNHLSAGNFIIIHPHALWETKLWLDEEFARLSERIYRECGLAVVLTGGTQGETRQIQQLTDVPTVSLAGETSLRELACLYQKAAVVVTTDTGPMHIAAAAGARVLALFGPTDPALTGPFGPGHCVIHRSLSCRPCFRKSCDTKECMRSITADEVFQALESLLSRNSG